MGTVSLPLRLAVGGELQLKVATSPRPGGAHSPGRSRKKEPQPFSFPWRKVEFEKRMAAEREECRRERKERESPARGRQCDYYTDSWQPKLGCNLGQEISGRIEQCGDPLARTVAWSSFGNLGTPRKGLLATQRAHDATLSSPRLQKFVSPRVVKEALATGS